MRIRYTESFPKKSVGAEGAFRLIRKIIDDRLAEEILKRLRQDGNKKPSEIA